MNYTADIAIIGGGASGLIAAITAKRLNPSQHFVNQHGNADISPSFSDVEISPFLIIDYFFTS